MSQFQKKKKPFINKRNRIKRKKWIKENKYWKLEQWKSIL